MATISETLALAVQHHQAGRLTQAEQLYRLVLQHEPRQPDALHLLGMVAYQVGQYAQAVELIGRAIAISPRAASYHNNLGLVYRALGRDADAEASYRQSLQLQPNFPEALNNLGNVLRDRGELNGAVELYRRALELKPAYAEAHNNLGTGYYELGKVSEAIGCYRRAIELKPDYGEAWGNLGVALQHEGQLAPALDACRRGVELKPNEAAGYNHWGSVLRQQHQYGQALACYEQALRLKPRDPRAHKGKGACLFWQGRMTEAIDSFQQSLHEASQDAETHTNLSLALLIQGRLAEGWPEYEWRWRVKGRPLPEVGLPQWDGTPLDGKTILLVTEQGIGDTLFLIRYAAVLKERFDCRVVAMVPRRLVALVGTCPGIDELVAQEDATPTADVFVPLGSIPARLNETLASIPGKVPYLTAEAELVASWQQRLAHYDGLKIGVVWQGNPQFQADHSRSFPLAELAPLAGVPGVRLFSLQKGYGAEQLGTLGDAFEVIDLGTDLDSTTPTFVETAAVLKNLDVVIAPDTALAHLAGAVGVEVWLALSYPADWRWFLDREDSPWYPTARLFRQPKLGDWASVFRRMADTLAQRPRGPA